ncbi:cyanase [Allohahella marinimesophila]|uniref:Cyanate hydratase n=1 Tax=Allohahella marinimesophila TaxID=1054972 RepID=A0ABP7PMF8_9GAMM
MKKVELTEAIINAKKEKGLSWEAIADAAGKSVVWTTSACLGMNSFPEDTAHAVLEFLDLPADLVADMTACPHKAWEKAVPQDPLVYRIYEIVGVYGDTLKEIIHEKFGDGIMSAIDFHMDVQKEENPKGDRVVITMNGKFLKYSVW